MKRSLAILALALLASTALAADNAVIVTPGSGVTMRTTDVGALVQSPNVILSSAAGVAIYGTAGSPPAGTNILTVQGIASMTPLLVTATVTGTAAVTQSGTWTVRNTGNAGAIYDGVIGAATAPANMTVGGGVFNSSPITLTTGQSSALQFDANGFLKVNTAAGAAAGGTSSNFGSAFPTPGTAIGAKNGANMVNLNADGSGNLLVSVATATGLAQASTTSGQTGSMVMGATTTNPPAYSNGQTNPVSLDVAGNTRVITGLGTIGGTTPKLLNALSNTATTVKASAGQLFELYCYNPNATVAYIQVFDVSGAVTVGTTPAAASYGIPATSSAGRVLSVVGTQFANAIKVAATTAVANGTAPGSALDCNASFN